MQPSNQSVYINDLDMKKISHLDLREPIVDPLWQNKEWSSQQVITS